MPCLIAAIALLLPRFAMILLFLFTDYLGRAYATALWPLLGFIFMPYTTLAYAWAMNSNGSVSGGYLVVVVLGVLLDLGALGGGGGASRTYTGRSR